MITTEQNEAIYAEGPLCVTAGAGTGKTTVLTERYLRLIRDGISPRRILAVTFTTDAAFELKRRVLERAVELELSSPLRKELAKTPHIGTLHSFCFRLLNEYSTILGYAPIERILEPLEWEVRLAEEEEAWTRTVDPETLARFYETFGAHPLRELLRAFYFHADAAAPEGHEESIFSFLSNALRGSVKSLNKRLRLSGLYTFDDLERLALQILDTSNEVRHRVQGHFDAVLVDEFQDTSRRQHAILKHVMGHHYSRLFLVGDPKQSVYRFRDADVGLFSKAQEEVHKWGGRTVSLTQNFRSTINLLEVFNTYSDTHFSVDHRLQAGRGDLSSGLKVIRHHSKDSEVELVTNEVRRLLDNHERPEDIALLFRAGSRIDAFQASLERSGILTRHQRSLPLFFSYAVLDISAFLHTVANPLCDFHLSAFLRSDFVGLSLDELSQICQRKGESLFEKIFGDKRFNWFLELVESGESSLKHVLSRGFAHAGTLLDPSHSLELIRALLQLTNSIPQAVSILDCWKESEASLSIETEREQAVLCATVHSVKGLEFKHVFLVDLLRQPPRKLPIIRFDENHAPAFRTLENGTWVTSPRYMAIAEKDSQLDASESTRILYVAMTRAKDTLYLSLPAEGSGAIPALSWASVLDRFLQKQGMSEY